MYARTRSLAVPAIVAPNPVTDASLALAGGKPVAVDKSGGATIRPQCRIKL